LEARCLLAGDVVLDWNAIALEANRMDHSGTVADQGGPTRTSRALAIVHAAIYDTVNAITGSHAPYAFPTRAPQGTDVRAAVAAAAHHSLRELYPHQQDQLDALLESYLDEVDLQGTGPESLAFGQAVAEHILDLRQDDGANHDMVYLPGSELGQHLVDPLHPTQGFLTAGWGSVAPFTLESGSQFIAPPPPELTSSEYAAAYEEVQVVGALDAEVRDRDENGLPDRTPEQTTIGVFWGYDGSKGLGTPPRMYNQIARTLAIQEGNSMEENARLFAQINLAMADAGIASWDSKYIHEFWRPVVAIRQGDVDGNPDTELDADWAPLGAPASNSDQPGADFTPPFPAYTSGHATFGAAMFRVLERFFGTDELPFDFQSDECNGVTRDSAGNVRPPVTRHFDRLSQAAQENALSRIYLGIHWSFDAEQGIVQGTAVADHVVDSVLLPAADDLPGIESLVANSPSVSRGEKVTLTAHPNPGDSGISQVEFWEDDGDWVLNPGLDNLLGLGTNSGDGWKLTLTVNQQDLGRNVVFARVQDGDGQWSPAASAVLSVISHFTWHNSTNPMDVTADGSVAPLDVLRIFIELNDPEHHANSGRLNMPMPKNVPGYFDVNRDDYVTPLDALIIINDLNERSVPASL
jgi:hypothetical protein